jgi:hypothetical protein
MQKKKMKISNFSFNDNNFFLVFLYFLIFYIFVIPYSATINGGGVSVNYFFALFPVISFFIKKEMMFPPKSVIAFMVMLCIIFIYGSISQVDFYEFFFRRSASFFIFMAVFAFMFVKIDENMILAFKCAIILWALYDSTLTITEYISIDGNAIGAHAKGILGSQRVGIIYLMGFWSVITFNFQNNYIKCIKFILAFIILSGIFLTYSRSSMLGLGASSLAYFIYLGFNTLSSNSIKYTFTKLASSGLYFSMMFALVFLFFNGSVHFYSNTIFNYIFKTEVEFINEGQNSVTTSFQIYDQIITKSEEQHNYISKVIKEFDEDKYYQPTPTEIAKIYVDFIVNENLFKTLGKEEQHNFISNVTKEFYENTQELDQITKRLYQNQKQYELLVDLNEHDQFILAQLKKKINESNRDIQEMDFQQQYDASILREERSYRNLREHMTTVTRYEYQVQLKILRLLSIELDKLLQDSNFNNHTNEIEVSIANKIKVDLKKSIVDLELITMEITPFQKRLSNKGTSIGYRAFMHKKVYEEILKKPLTGSAFLGVWSMFESKKGSAHSQYLDVLFRVGILGFIIYMIFLFKVTLALLKIDIGLFLGLIAIIFVGLVHETFKLSQGGFMYSFLFGIWAQRAILSKNDRKFS